MIELKNVSKSYAGNVKAVDNVTLKIEPGSVYGFLGPNGAGKTTTIKLITGVLQPDRGRITVGGHNIQTADLEAKKCIGFVPDNPDAFLNLTGLEYLNFMADMYEVSEDDRRTRLEHLSKLLSMDEALDDMLSYSWEYPQEPDTVVTWRLEGSAGKTRLTLVHSGFAPDRNMEDYQIGWLHFLNRIKFMAEVGAAWQKAQILIGDY